MSTYSKTTSLILIVATAHKVGSTWLYRMLKDIPLFLTPEIPQPFNQQGTIDLTHPDSIQFLQGLEGGFVFKSHSAPVPNLKNYVFPARVEWITMYRDPRDVIVSASFFLNHLSVENGGFEERYRQLSDHGRILALIQQPRGIFILDLLEQWFRKQNAYGIYYENLKLDPVGQMEKLMQHLNLAVDRWLLERVVQDNSFKAQSGRNAGCEDKGAKLRKGIVGDWKNHFTKECIYAFKTAHNGRWNQLLVNLGYENTLDW